MACALWCTSVSPSLPSCHGISSLHSRQPKNVLAGLEKALAGWWNGGGACCRVEGDERGLTPPTGGSDLHICIVAHSCAHTPCTHTIKKKKEKKMCLCREEGTKKRKDDEN